jgi:hypothetical protein
MSTGLDPALKFIGAVAVITSIVGAGIAAYLFSRGERSSALLLLLILVVGYTAMSLAWMARRRRD